MRLNVSCGLFFWWLTKKLELKLVELINHLLCNSRHYIQSLTDTGPEG